MKEPRMDAADLYLSVLKKSILNELYIDNEARLVYYAICAAGQHIPDPVVVREIATQRPDILEKLRETRTDGRIASFWWEVPFQDGSIRSLNLRNITEFYHSMIGRARLNNIHSLLDRVVADGVPGDLIETGVWRGGATLLMRGFLAAHNITDRKVWVADSFAGLPVPSHPADAGYDFSAAVAPVLAISRDEVEDLFLRYELLDDQVRFLEGWFSDTLPNAPIDRLALMRLDGDLYESTMDAITALYDKLSPGGYVIVDDYNDFEPCRRAITEFRESRGITSDLQTVDWTAVYWRKDA
jgi:O-methyltransferase